MEKLLNQTARTAAAAEEEVEDHDPFKRLPEEIILSHIFNQIPDAKSLFRISLVSKYFSHLAYKAHSVSVKIPICISPEDFDDFKRSLKLQSLSFRGKALYLIATAPLRLFRSIMKRLYPLPSSPADYLGLYLVKVTKFLQKFTSMRFLYLEYDYPKYCVLEKEPVIKWKMGCKCDCLLFLTASSLDTIAPDCDSLTEDPVDDGLILTTEMIQLLFTLFQAHLVTVLTRFSMVKNLVPFLNESLQNVSVTDSKKHGQIDLGEDDLVELRKQDDEDLGNGEARLRIWRSRSLKLPLSRCAMQSVTLYLFQVQEEKENKNDDLSLMAKQVFDGEEEKVFAEAAMKMLSKDAVFDKILVRREF